MRPWPLWRCGVSNVGRTHARTDAQVILCSVQCYALHWTDNEWIRLSDGYTVVLSRTPTTPLFLYGVRRVKETRVEAVDVVLITGCVTHDVRTAISDWRDALSSATGRFCFSGSSSSLEQSTTYEDSRQLTTVAVLARDKSTPLPPVVFALKLANDVTKIKRQHFLRRSV